ncbi:serine/threonine-protein kinase [uncultured Jatrophihabitans sp.]|uniref:serine/threonine-protein kinase n=1 Tax=uncultured Jatrophihabitans sp. TaxID=1610747 RepID=UPI0035C9A42E
MESGSVVGPGTPAFGPDYADVALLRAGSRFTLYSAHEVAAERDVIVKVPNIASPDWLHDALEVEATILDAIGRHPNVITLYHRLRAHDGRPALVLERCPGSLDDVAEDNRMSLREAAAAGIKIADALEALHASGYAHRDVRPANVLLTAAGEPVLAGFDEAVPLDGDAGYGPLHITTAHTAPELLEGAAPTPASDVYGLASTLYELIAGRAAFREYTGESAATIIVRVLSNPVRPITTPGVPLDVSDLLTWALTGDPARRPPTPAWIAEELGRIERRQGWPRTRHAT